MDASTTKWWDAWKKRKQRESRVLIELWDETELRSLLMSPDARTVRMNYYEPSRQALREEAELVGLVDEDAAKMETALFVRQLREAGHVEVAASKHQFFNAELMAREIADKGVPTELAVLRSADALVHALWEEHFNDLCQVHEGARLHGLHRLVMGEIRIQHGTLARGLPGGPVHMCGLMHRVVDNRRAGWVRHWRQIAEEHAEVDQSYSSSTIDGDSETTAVSSQ